MANNSKKCAKDDCECGEDCECEDHAPKNQMMPNFDEETQAQIQQMQMMEQNFEQLLQQKHLFNMEISETDLAVTELEKSEGDVFKLVGSQVIIKTTKEKLSADLKHKKDLLEVRLKAIENQEKQFAEKIEELRQTIMQKISPRD